LPDQSKEEIAARNMEIYKKYKSGVSITSLSEVYYLSPKSIQKIIAKIKIIAKNFIKKALNNFKKSINLFLILI